MVPGRIHRELKTEPLDCGLFFATSSLEEAMPNPKYEVIIYWSAEDQGFIAEVPELPGCAADGKTHREALKNVERVITEWLETAHELGRSIPKPKRRLVLT
jgi:predicted RNase H-like HicB family nuclease